MVYPFSAGLPRLSWKKSRLTRVVVHVVVVLAIISRTSVLSTTRDEHTWIMSTSFYVLKRTYNGDQKGPVSLQFLAVLSCKKCSRPIVDFVLYAMIHFVLYAMIH